MNPSGPEPNGGGRRKETDPAILAARRARKTEMDRAWRARKRAEKANGAGPSNAASDRRAEEANLDPAVAARKARKRVTDRASYLRRKARRAAEKAAESVELLSGQSISSSSATPGSSNPLLAPNVEHEGGKKQGSSSGLTAQEIENLQQSGYAYADELEDEADVRAVSAPGWEDELEWMLLNWLDQQEDLE